MTSPRFVFYASHSRKVPTFCEWLAKIRKSVEVTFIETHNMDRVRKVQMRIIDEYKDDMVKYSDDSIKPNIRECFDSLPRQLAKENKKFQYSVIKKHAPSMKTSWLMSLGRWDAGYIIFAKTPDSAILTLPFYMAFLMDARS